jgi:hypothetical protein
MRSFAELDQRSYIEIQRRIAACMASSGFGYRPVHPQSLVNRERARNPLNPAWLEYGYSGPPEEPVDDNQPDTSTAFDEQLMRQGGCFDRARQQVTGTSGFIDGYVAYTDSFVADVIAAYDTTEEARATGAAWADCMASQGFDVSNRSDLATNYLQDDAVGTNEHAVQVVDRECDISTRLTETRSRWQVAALDQWMVEHEAERVALDAAAAQFADSLNDLETEAL